MQFTQTAVLAIFALATAATAHPSDLDARDPEFESELATRQADASEAALLDHLLSRRKVRCPSARILNS